MQEMYTIGIDLGGTKIEAAAITLSGEIIHSHSILTKVTAGYPGVKAQLVEIIHTITSLLPANSLLGIGIGVPGQVEAKTGDVIFAPNLQWHQVPLLQDLEEACNSPIFVLNDLRAITVGEWLFGAGKNSSNLFCMFIGTGIGGGMICEGRLMQGSENSFGEVGHTPVNFKGPICTCGNHGCLEAYAGGWAIARNAKERIQADPSKGKAILKHCSRVEDINATHVFQAYREGDPLASEVVEEAIEALIAGCIGVVNLTNPEKLILGGGVLNGFQGFFQRIKRGIEKGALKVAVRSLEIVPAALGKHSGVIGAAAMVIHNQKRGNVGNETTYKL